MKTMSIRLKVKFILIPTNFEAAFESEHFYPPVPKYADTREKHHVLESNINISDNTNYTNYVDGLYKRKKLMANGLAMIEFSMDSRASTDADNLFASHNTLRIAFNP